MSQDTCFNCHRPGRTEGCNRCVLTSAICLFILLIISVWFATRVFPHIAQ